MRIFSKKMFLILYVASIIFSSNSYYVLAQEENNAVNTDIQEESTTINSDIQEGSTTINTDIQEESTDFNSDIQEDISAISSGNKNAQIASGISSEESTAAEIGTTTTEEIKDDDSWKEDANEPLDNAVPVIYGYEIEGDGYIVPGEEFTLKFNVYNPAVVSKVGNIQIVVSQDDMLIYPKYGSTNSVYIGYLLPLSYAEGKITMVASDQINVDQISVNITMSYTDNYYPNTSKLFNAILPVSTNGNLKINDVSLPANVYKGTNNRLRVSYKNSGLTAVNDVVLHISGDAIDNQNISIGTIGNGSGLSSDVYIDFIDSGKQSVELYFSYSDSDGKSYETDVEKLSFEVQDNRDSLTSEDFSNRNIINNVITITVFLGSFLIVLIYILLIVRNKKKDKSYMKGHKDEVHQNN